MRTVCFNRLDTKVDWKGFSTLMGVKKKDDTSVSESPQETASTESTSGSAPQGATGAGASGSSLNYGVPEITDEDVAFFRQAAAMFPGARPLTTGQMATIQDVLSDVQEEQANKPTFEELQAARDEAVFTPEGMDFLKRADEGEDVQKQAEDMAMVLHPAARREYLGKLYRNLDYDENQVERMIQVADEFATEQLGSEKMQAYAKYGFTPGQMVDPLPFFMSDVRVPDGRGGFFENRYSTMSQEEMSRLNQGLPEGYDDIQFSTLSERQEFWRRWGVVLPAGPAPKTALDEADKRLVADLEVAGDYKTFSLFEQIAQNYAQTFGALSDETEKRNS